MKTNPELQKSKMREYAENRGVEPSQIDFDSILKSDLTEEENWEEFRQHIAKRKGFDTVKQLEREMSQLEILQTDKTVEDFYRNFNRDVEMIAEGYHNAMLVNSPPGIGKTYQIEQSLENSAGNDGYVKLAGHVSPMKLYITLYENKNKTIFLDDVEGLINNDTALSTLKQATEMGKKQRKVRWTSSTSRLKDRDGEEINEEFTFTGQIIMCFNEVPDDRHFQALRNRCIYHELDFTYEERIQLIMEVAKNADKQTTLDREQREEVARWIAKNTTPAYEGVNIRTLMTAFNRREYSEENWKEMTKPSLHERSDLAKILELQEEYEDVERQAEEFSKSRRTFYRKKKELERRAGEL